MTFGSSTRAETDDVFVFSRARQKRTSETASGGFTVTEMLVAMMLLTVGTLALYHSMATSTALAENSSRHVAATQVAASEIERIRTLPYDLISLRVAASGSTEFEEALQVTDATHGLVEPTAAVQRDGVTYNVERYVTWRPASVQGEEVPDAYKQLTVIVSWSDERGEHDVRSASAISELSAP